MKQETKEQYEAKMLELSNQEDDRIRMCMEEEAEKEQNETN